MRGKSEIRNPKSETNSNWEMGKYLRSHAQPEVLPLSGFGFVSIFGFRISDLVPP